MRTPALGVVMTAVLSLLAACVAPPEQPVAFTPGRFVLTTAAGSDDDPPEGPPRAVEVTGGLTDGGPTAAGPPDATPSAAPTAAPTEAPTPYPTPTEVVRNTSGGGSSGGGGAPPPTPTPTPAPALAIDVTDGGFADPAASEAAVARP